MGGSAPNGLGLVNMPYTKPNPKPTLPLGAAQPTCGISPSHLEVSGLQRYILEKTRLLLEEVLVRPAGGAHPVVCVGPNAPV